MNSNNVIVRTNGNIVRNVDCGKNVNSTQWNGMVQINPNVNSLNRSYPNPIRVQNDAHRKVYTKRSTLPQIAIKRKDNSSPSSMKTEVPFEISLTLNVNFK